MQNANLNHHALITTLARCLSGQWLIEPTWLLNNIDLIARADRNEDLSAVWPKPSLTYMVNRDGDFQSASRDGITGKGTAMGVVSVVGPIYKYGWYGTKTLISNLKALAYDDQVGAVMIRMDSPGGQHAGTREAYELIRDYPKPTLVVVDDLMASAGLYIGSAGSKIVATQPTAQVGSLGTYVTVADWLAYYESQGLKFYETYAPDSTEKNESYRQIIASQGKNRELTEKSLKVLNDHFIIDVRDVRGDKLNKAVENGRLYFTNDAITMGVIDEMVPDKDTLPLLADMYNATKQTTIMGLKSTLLNLVNGMSDDETPSATTDQAAQITQLTTERDAAQSQVTALTNQVNTLTTEKTGLQTQITTLTTERDSLQEKVTAYGSQPGDRPTQVLKPKDDVPAADGDTKTLQQILDELPSEKEAAEQGY